MQIECEVISYTVWREVRPGDMIWDSSYTKIKKKKKRRDPMDSPSVMCELELSPAGSKICLELLQK